MKMKSEEKEYLSDEELLQLIMQVEEHELVPAPPNMLDEILAHVEVQLDESLENKAIRVDEFSEMPASKTSTVFVNTDAEQAGIRNMASFPVDTAKAQLRSQETKRKEFYQYCIRVITSVAAAIAIIFAIPGMEPVKTSEIPSKQEMVGAVITREEALRETEFFPEIQDMWNLYNKKDGGK